MRLGCAQPSCRPGCAPLPQLRRRPRTWLALEPSRSVVGCARLPRYTCPKPPLPSFLSTLYSGLPPTCTVSGTCRPAREVRSSRCCRGPGAGVPKEAAAAWPDLRLRVGLLCVVLPRLRLPLLRRRHTVLRGRAPDLRAGQRQRTLARPCQPCRPGPARSCGPSQAQLRDADAPARPWPPLAPTAGCWASAEAPRLAAHRLAPLLPESSLRSFLRARQLLLPGGIKRFLLHRAPCWPRVLHCRFAIN